MRIQLTNTKSVTQKVHTSMYRKKKDLACISTENKNHITYIASRLYAIKGESIYTSTAAYDTQLMELGNSLGAFQLRRVSLREVK